MVCAIQCRLFGVLFAAGAISADAWLERGRRRARQAAFGIGLVASAGLLTVVMLPVIPPRALGGTFVPVLYKESGAQIGWPELVRTVERVADELPSADRARAVTVASNYGEASALILLGHNLPPVYSGHNAFDEWGPPPERAGPVILVGYVPRYIPVDAFNGCSVRATIDNGLGLRNDEQGLPVWLCTSRSTPWRELWPQLEHLD